MITINLGYANGGGDHLAQMLELEGDEVQVEATTVREAFVQLAQLSPKAQVLYQMLFEKDYQPKAWWLVSANNGLVDCLRNPDTPIKDGDEIFITTPYCQLFLKVVLRDLAAASAKKVDVKLIGH